MKVEIFRFIANISYIYTVNTTMDFISQPLGYCHLNLSSDTALHNKNVTPSDSVPQVTASAILDIGVVGFGITASVPVVFESISLVILAYSGSGNFIGKVSVKYYFIIVITFVIIIIVFYS